MLIQPDDSAPSPPREGPTHEAAAAAPAPGFGLRRLWNRLHMGNRPRRWWNITALCFVALALLFSVRYVTQEPPPISTASPYAHGDGVYYYLYLRSLMFDNDVDFRNDLELLGNPFHIGIARHTGRPRNFWTGGTALFWTPFAVYARLHLATTNALGWTHEEPHGAGHTFQRVTLFGSVFWGLVAIGLIGFFVRPLYGDKTAIFAMLGVSFASPLPWYMLRQPSFSHAVSAAAVAMFVVYWYRSQKQRRLRGWILLGALLGLAMLVRPQNALHALLPFSEWLAGFLAAVRAKHGKRVLSALLNGWCFALTAWGLYFIQIYTWKRIYGRWMLDAHESSFLHFGSSRFLETLFASRMGLFAWHPLLYVSVLGLVGAALLPVLPRKARQFSGLALAVFFLQAVVNGAAVDWWAGWSFGGRRFMDCAIYFGFGLAAALAALVHLATRASSFVIKVALPLAVLAVPSVINAQLAEDYMLRRIPPGQPQVMEALWAGATSRLINKVYQVTGNWGSAPLNWWFAHAAGVSPARYDLLSSNEVLYDRASIVLPLSDARFALEGFGPAETVEGRAASPMPNDTAIIGFALRKGENLAATLDVFAPKAGATLELVLSGETVLNKLIDAPGWQSLPFDIPKRALRSGINLAHVRLVAPGEGMQQPPQWAMSALTLRRKSP